MRKLKVASSHHTYPIYIGYDIYNQLPSFLYDSGFSNQQRVLIITDSNVVKLHAEKVMYILRYAGFQVEISVIPAGEKSKSFTQLDKIISQCLNLGLDRNSFIIALGGGVVGDLAGFVAAIYMRGIPFVQLPTTILAHDSSIGGKVGINHLAGKNLIGAFHSPLLVVFDVETIMTLSDREVRSGFAEVIKHGLIRDASFCLWLEENADSLLSLNPILLEKALFRGCQIKASIVMNDERELDIRAILNYGHTVGHALEKVVGYGHYTHGEAISIGMIAAAHLSCRVLQSSQKIVYRTEKLLQAFKLPISLDKPVSKMKLLRSMLRDKKVTNFKYTFILSPEIGDASKVVDIEEKDISAVLTVLNAI